MICKRPRGPRGLEASMYLVRGTTLCLWALDVLHRQLTPRENELHWKMASQFLLARCDEKRSDGEMTGTLCL